MNEFEYNVLLTKEKEELDKIKLALEIASFRENKQFEKKKYKSEVFRVFIIAIMSSAISIATTYFFNKEEYKNTQVKETKDALRSYKLEYDKAIDLVQKNSFACDIANLDNKQNDQYIINEILKFKNICNSSSNLNIISNVDTNRADGKIVLSYLKKIEALNLSLSKTENDYQKKQINDSLEITNKKISQISNISPNIKKLIESTNQINQDAIQRVNATQNHTSTPSINGDIIKQFDLQWFKEGYSLQFGNINVLCQYLDKNIGIQVKVCQTIQPYICKIQLLNQTWLKLDEPLIVSDGSFNYQISLKAIDHAGKDPITLAAFLEVVKFISN